MSDSDQTILSTRGVSDPSGSPEEPEKPKRNPLLIIGGIGCALLLCAGLALGGVVYFMGDQLRELAGLPPSDEVVVTEEAFAPTAEPATTSTPILEATDEATAAPTETATDTPEPTPVDPEIRDIVFALDVTEQNEPVDPGTEFEGEVTKVHAIFEYSGLSPDLTWERVWFLDGEEMFRTTESWSGAENGVFDYFINAGGEPLSPGEWVLELYVEDELLATGSFVILPDEDALAAAATGEATEEATDEAAQADAETDTEATVEPGEDGDDISDLVIEESDETTEHDVDLPPAQTPTPAPTATPSTSTYRLAYTKWDGGQHNLYVGDTAGSTEQFIIGRAAGPSWMPDGSAIFFYGEAGIDRQEIDNIEYVFDGISNGIVAVTMSPMPGNISEVQLSQNLDWKDGAARWTNVSPNGQMVAFDSRRSGNYRIYFLGTGENQQFRYEILGEHGDWSPDSEKFVYRSGRGGTTGVWISNRDDSGHTLITNGGSDSFPAWSPDGETIAFSRDEGGSVDIYTVNPDGTNLTRLTEAPGPDTLPVFTPDGQIIFRSARGGNWSIWKMNGDGSNQVEIIPDANVGPDWSYSRMSVLP